MRAHKDSLGAFEQIVLTAVMSLGDGAYGRAIYDEACRVAGKDVNLGSTYVTLDRMEDKGYVVSWESEPIPERGGRSRRYYRLEHEGLRALEKAMAQSRRMVDIAKEWGMG